MSEPDDRPLSPAIWLATHNPTPPWLFATGTLLDLVLIAIALPFLFGRMIWRRHYHAHPEWNSYRGLLHCVVTSDELIISPAKPTAFGRVPSQPFLRRDRHSLVQCDITGPESNMVTLRFDTGFYADLHLVDSREDFQRFREAALSNVRQIDG